MTTVIFKPTEACNGNCVYCDVVRKDREKGARLPFETLERFFIRINEYLLERPDERFQVIWHGGEPLLLGPDYFVKAYEFQETHCAETKERISHEIQSNITLLSREYLQVFRMLGIERVSTSYDPIPNVRGLGNTVDSAAYNRRFMESLALLEEEGIDWGMIYVVTKLSLQTPLELFYFLTNLNKTGSVKFNPIYHFKRKIVNLAVTPEEFVEFLGAIFPVWWEHQERFKGIRPFRSFVESIIERSGGIECSESGMCADTHISVGPAGSYSQCGRSSDWGLLDYGTIQGNAISTVLEDPQKGMYRARQLHLKAGECKGCRFWEICHGGCPLDSYAETGDWMKKSPLCAYKKGFIEKYFEPITGVRYDPEGSQTARTSREPEMPQTPPDFAVDHAVTFPRPSTDRPVWINPFGGCGDTIILSGVLKAAVDQDPQRRFSLVNRTSYGEILRGHPAVDLIGNPPPGSAVIGTAYWDHPGFGGPNGRPFRILAGMLGVTMPAEERLFVPFETTVDEMLLKSIPFTERNVLICPWSLSPRKDMPIGRWEDLVKQLTAQGIFVAQAGTRRDRYVRGAWSLLGVTTVREAIALVGRFDAIVTVDNLFVHAARLVGTPAVVLWGATDPATFGWPGQTNLVGHRICQNPNGCLTGKRAGIYNTPCPMEKAHCVNRIEVDSIVTSVKSVLSANRSGDTVTESGQEDLMHPILFTIGNHTVWAYGFFVTAGYLAGVALFLFLAKRDGLGPWTGVDIVLWMLPAALLGAKLLFIVTNWATFVEHPSPLASGWSFQGALFGALAVAIVLFRKRRLDAWRWLDTAAPALALVVTVGRIGCLMAGCCWGVPTGMPWGIVFTESHAAPLSTPLQPTQAYYIIANLIIVAILLVRRKTAAFRGELILLFVLLYVTSRSIIDPLRGAPERHWFLGTVTTYQLITIAAILVVGVLYYRIRRRDKAARIT